MNRATLGALVLVPLIPALLAGCSSDDDDPGADPAATVTVTDTLEPDPLELATDTVRGTACLGDPELPDLAWFDVQWRANVDLEEFAFALVGAEGVRQVGSAETVPPVNFGGRIDFAGDATWEGHHAVLAKARGLRGTEVESADFWSPTAGETGLAVLHLRFDPKVLRSEKGGRIGGVRATYTSADGAQGEVEVDVPLRLRAGDC